MDKQGIIDQDLVQIKNLSKSFDDNFFTESSKNSVMAVNDVSLSLIHISEPTRHA